jgi:hypothetical protein
MTVSITILSIDFHYSECRCYAKGRYTKVSLFWMLWRHKNGTLWCLHIWDQTFFVIFSHPVPWGSGCTRTLDLTMTWYTFYHSASALRNLQSLSYSKNYDIYLLPQSKGILFWQARPFLKFKTFFPLVSNNLPYKKWVNLLYRITPPPPFQSFLY